MRYLKMLLAAGTIFAFASCERTDVDQIGPSVYIAPDNFQVQDSLAANPSEVNFNDENVDFSAAMSDQASWTISIRGMQSGAVKDISGNQPVINAANASWNGNHSGTVFFETGETAVASLSFMGSDVTMHDTITINEAKDFGASPNHLLLTAGGFEDPSDIAFPTWVPFNDYEQGVASDINGISAVQGNNYYYIDGANPADNYVDGIRYDFSSFPSALQGVEPSEVWVNIYLYGEGNEDVQFTYSLKEADGDEDNDEYAETEDDAMEVSVTPDEGWNLYSFRYDNLSPSTAADFGGSGNKVHEPHRLRSVQFNLNSQTMGENVRLIFDYPIITIGAPFDPTK